MPKVDEIKARALEAGREAVAAGAAHRKLFWQVSDGETRYLNPKRTLREGMPRMSQGRAQDLTDKSFAREDALTISEAAWTDFGAAIEELRDTSPSAAGEVTLSISRLDAASRDDKESA